MTAAHDWSGRVGEVWAAEWPRTDRALAGLAAYLDAAILVAAPAGAFTALDIGCGAGATSLALARVRPDATVVGVDLSAELVAVAQERAAALPNTRFEQGDAAAVTAGMRPDLLVSRHGVMFFPDPHAAFAQLRAAAAPAARLVFTCFAPPALNPWASLVTDPPRPAAYTPGPFAFADPAFVRDLLIGAGWRGVEERRVDFAYRAGAGQDAVTDAMHLLTRIGPAASALRDRPPAERPAFEARLRGRLDAQRTGDVIDFPAAAWLWVARA